LLSVGLTALAPNLLFQERRVLTQKLFLKAAILSPLSDVGLTGICRQTREQCVRKTHPQVPKQKHKPHTATHTATQPQIATQEDPSSIPFVRVHTDTTL